MIDTLPIAAVGDYHDGTQLQRITLSDLQRITHKSRTLSDKVRHAFQGVPIYVGHPDDDGGIAKQEFLWGPLSGLAIVGRVKYLFVSDDKLYGRIDLTDIGAELVSSGGFTCFSPRWQLERENNKVGVIPYHPVRLVSLGLVKPVVPRPRPQTEVISLQERISKLEKESLNRLEKLSKFSWHSNTETPADNQDIIVELFGGGRLLGRLSSYDDGTSYIETEAQSILLKEVKRWRYLYQPIC